MGSCVSRQSSHNDNVIPFFWVDESIDPKKVDELLAQVAVEVEVEKMAEEAHSRRMEDFHRRLRALHGKTSSV